MKRAPHTGHSSRLGRAVVRLTIGAAAIALGGYAYGASHSGPGASRPAPYTPAAARGARPYSYGWPVKPFDRQHPVRGNLGDPRTVFAGAPTRQGLLRSGGSFSFHQGIDVCAPDGTPVFPVRSGVVRTVTANWVQVDSGDGVAFQYWHIVPQVRPGDGVTARETVLGRIVKTFEHVHLTQLQNGLAVNPLAPGNLGPYADTTIPRVKGVEFRAGESGPELLDESLRGRVEIAIDASDAHPLPVPGAWHDLPVSPARLTYRIDRLPQHLLVRSGTSMDFSHELPHTSNMWRVYARGSHMNAPQIGSRRYWYQPGVYLYKLTPAPFDTRTLADGAYLLTVTAWDTAGNHGSGTYTFGVHNHAGPVG